MSDLFSAYKRPGSDKQYITALRMVHKKWFYGQSFTKNTMADLLIEKELTSPIRAINLVERIFNENSHVEWGKEYEN